MTQPKDETNYALRDEESRAQGEGHPVDLHQFRLRPRRQCLLQHRHRCGPVSNRLQPAEPGDRLPAGSEHAVDDSRHDERVRRPSAIAPNSAAGEGSRSRIRRAPA